MNLRPSDKITNSQLNSGLNYVIADGLSAEAMVVFTSGTFLTAMAIHMGATNLLLQLSFNWHLYGWCKNSITAKQSPRYLTCLPACRLLPLA
jgi:hypothetical protein